MDASKKFYALAAAPDPPPENPRHGVVDWVNLISRLDEKRRQALFEALGGDGRMDGWHRRRLTMLMIFALVPEERERLWAVVSEWADEKTPRVPP